MPTPETSRQPDTALSIFYALGANVAIAVAKFGGALYTGSGALLAEAFHSLADAGNEALLLLGRKQAKARPSARHPLGEGRATYFWSFVVTLMLFTLGGVFSIREGIHRLKTPADIDEPWVGVAIVVFAMLAEGVSLRMALRQIAKARHGRTLWRWFRDTRHSELIVVLSEDLTAVIGLGLAMAALLATIATGNSLYDALGSLAIGVLLVVVATGVAIEIKSLLIGESASPKTRRALRAFLEARADIVEVKSLVTMQHGDDLMIAVQLRLSSGMGSAEMIRTIAACKRALQAEFPQAASIFLEPVGGSADPPRRSTSSRNPASTSRPATASECTGWRDERLLWA